MKAFEVFAIYVTPFLIVGTAIKLLMKRYAVDLPEVKMQAPSRGADFCSELGVWTNKDAPLDDAGRQRRAASAWSFAVIVFGDLRCAKIIPS
jgi:hypothetical protein